MNLKDYIKMFLMGAFLFIGGCFGNGTLQTINQKVEQTPIHDFPFETRISYTWKF